MKHLLDLDGVLVDSSKDIVGSLARAYYEVGYQGIIIPKDYIEGNIKDIINRTTPKISDSNKERVEYLYRQIYDVCGHEQTKLYPDVREFFEMVQDRAFLITSKPERPTRDIINKFHLGFRDVVCAIPNLSKGYLINALITAHGLEKKECLYVGDTAGDILASREAGIRCAICKYGYGNIAEIEKLNPEFTIDKLTEVLKIE